jgi:hypothetical protein
LIESSRKVWPAAATIESGNNLTFNTWVAREEMIMYQLRNGLKDAQNNGIGIGHFNVSDWVLLKAVVASAREVKVPVIAGVSELRISTACAAHPCPGILLTRM